jgi:HEAT repeat protein
MIGTPVDETVNGLIQCLQDEDVQVRFMAGLALCRLGASAQAAIPQLAIALDDENRYVRAHAAEALHYIGTEQAKDVLIKFLFHSRWCPTTTPANSFYP